MPLDNEIYRGIPDQPATLEEESSLCAPTLPSDVPATFRETPSAGAEPPKRNRRRILKAIKLLASSVAAVSICVAVGAVSLQPILASYNWPWFGPTESGYGISFTTESKNGNAVQFSLGDRSYRMEATRGDICMCWHESSDISYDGSTGNAYIASCSLTERWRMMLNISRTAFSFANEDEVYTTITATTGERFYLRAFSLSDTKEEDPAKVRADLSRQMNTLLSSITLTEALDYGWGRVFIGDTMYSEVHEEWSGIAAVNEAYWMIHYMARPQDRALSEEYLVGEKTIGDIHWKFYHIPFQGELWAVPQQEDIALGAYCDDLLNSYYSNGHGRMARGGVEDDEYIGTDFWSDQQIQFMVEEMALYLRYYHIR